QLRQSGFQILTAFDDPPAWPTCSVIGIHHCHTVLEFLGMHFHVGSRPEQARFLSGPERKTNASPRRMRQRSNGASSLQNRDGSGAVVLRTGCKIPGVEMAAYDDPLLGFFASADLRDHTAGINRT